jgi:hypothetical protein
MLTDANRKISIIAYYLSKFDMDAVRALGYENYSRAFEGVSARFGKNNSYMKLRRDEFDVLTGSSRKGWHKRPPIPTVLLLHNDLKNYGFEEFTQIVKLLIEDSDEVYQSPAIQWMTEESSQNSPKKKLKESSISRTSNPKWLRDPEQLQPGSLTIEFKHR